MVVGYRRTRFAHVPPGARRRGGSGWKAALGHKQTLIHRGGPGNGAAPVVTDEQRGVGAALVDEAADVPRQLVNLVRVDAVSPRREVCSRACRVRRLGIRPPRATESATASRTRTPESRAAERSGARQPTTLRVRQLGTAAGASSRPGTPRSPIGIVATGSATIDSSPSCETLDSG